MSIYNHEQQEESPWAILDPSLKQHSISIEPSAFGPAYIEHYAPLTQLHSIEGKLEINIKKNNFFYFYFLHNLKITLFYFKKFISKKNRRRTRARRSER